MLQTVEAIIHPDGSVRLNEPVEVAVSRRALVTILGPVAGEAALLSEASLAEDWSGAAEDAAWEHLADLPDVGDVAMEDDAATGTGRAELARHSTPE
jgi:hypothetical protein